MIKPLLMAGSLCIGTCIPNVQAYFTFDDNGATFKAKDYQINFGTLLAYDIFHAEADKTPIKDGSGWHDQRVFIKGSIGHGWTFKYNYDFYSESHKDAWIQYKPFALTAGQFKSPVGMENQQSARWWLFNEASMTSMLLPQRSLGIKWQPVINDQWLFAVSLQQANINDQDNMADAPLRTSTRIVYSPIHAKDAVAHLGASIQWIDYKDNHRSIRVATPPEVKFKGIPKFVDSGALKAESSQVGGLESGFSKGPLAITSEYIHHHIRTTEFKSYGFKSAYLQTSYFLDNTTYRTYNMANGTFDKPSKTNLTWELALRASRTEMDSGDIRGGIETNYSAGLNFYLNKNLKFALNYVDCHIDHGPGGDEHPSLVILRTQVAF